MRVQEPRQAAGARVVSPRARAAAGLADQAFQAGANAVNGLVAGYLLGPAPFGRYVAVIGIGFITIAVSRAFIGEVLLTYTARARGEEYQREIRDATASALTFGAVALVIAVGVWSLGFNLLRDLLWLAPFLPAILLADAGRYAFLSHRRPQRSMMITGLALLVQLGVVAGLVATDLVSGGTLLLAWGTGALVGSGVAVSLLRVNPLAGSPRRWMRGTRHLSTWFLGSAVLSQIYNWLVLYFVGGYLGEGELGGLRMLQMLVLMPVQNFIWALTGLIIPGYSAFAARGQVDRIRGRTRFLVTGYLAVFAGMLLLVPVGQWVVDEVLPAYQPYRELMWPIALQAGFYLMQSPLNAALRGMQRARQSFVQYAFFTVAVIPASLVGAVLFGVEGAAWGIAVGAASGGVAAFLLYRGALRQVPAEAAATVSDV